MEEVKNKKCDLCPYATKTNQNLKKHKKIHEKVIPLINECWDCDKKFNTKKALSDHMRTHNKKDKNIKCDLCDFKTDRKFNLKQHQKVHEKVPSDPLAFPTCSDCNKVFKTKDNLRA